MSEEIETHANMRNATTRRAWHSGVQAFYEDNLVSVYRFVFKRLRNREEAEDLTSQTILKAQRFLDPERSAHSAPSWLFQIAHTRSWTKQGSSVCYC